MKRVLAILGLLVIACAGQSYAQSGGIKDINLSPALFQAVHGQINVRNATGSDIAADKLIYVCGWTEVATAAIASSPSVQRPKVCLADADVAGARAQYLSGAGIGNGYNGVAIKSKRITGVNTNTTSVGDPIYLSATAGSWTITAPTPPAVVQIVGRVAIVSSTVGVIEINPDIESFQGVSSVDVTDGSLAPADLGLPIRNETAGNLVAGDLVYVSSWNETEARFLVAKADADAAGASPARYVIRGTIANNTNGLAYRTYTISGANTNGSTVGDPVYLDTTAGGWVLAAPTGADDINQIVGRVRVVSATVGKIEIDLMSLNSPVSVGTNEIQADAVTSAKIVADAVQASELGVTAGTVTASRAVVVNATKGIDQIRVGATNNIVFIPDGNDATLQAAITGITTATANNQFTIVIPGGRFTISAIAMKPWVNLRGQGGRGRVTILAGGSFGVASGASLGSGVNRIRVDGIRFESTAVSWINADAAKTLLVVMDDCPLNSASKLIVTGNAYDGVATHKTHCEFSNANIDNNAAIATGNAFTYANMTFNNSTLLGMNFKDSDAFFFGGQLSSACLFSNATTVAGGWFEFAGIKIDTAVINDPTSESVLAQTNAFVANMNVQIHNVFHGVTAPASVTAFSWMQPGAIYFCNSDSKLYAKTGAVGTNTWTTGW